MGRGRLSKWQGRRLSKTGGWTFIQILKSRGVDVYPKKSANFPIVDVYPNSKISRIDVYPKKFGLFSHSEHVSKL